MKLHSFEIQHQQSTNHVTSSTCELYRADPWLRTNASSNSSTWQQANPACVGSAPTPCPSVNLRIPRPNIQHSRTSQTTTCSLYWSQCCHATFSRMNCPVDVDWRQFTWLIKTCDNNCDVCGRRHPCSWRSDVHGCPLSATVHFRWPDDAFGTICHLMSRQLQRSLLFGIASRHILFSRSFPA